MRCLPRLAVGTVQAGVVREGMVGALATALQWLGDSPVLFHSSCAFAAADISRAALGRPSRHVDSWAMTRSDAASALAQGAGEQETAIVEGPFDAALPPSPPSRSSLDALSEWLDLPQIGILDVRLLKSCDVIRRPARLEGLLLLGVGSAEAAAYWQTALESLWQAPVLGWLNDGLPAAAADHPGTAPAAPTREWFEFLGRRLAPTLRVDRLRSLARRAPPLIAAPDFWLLSGGERRFRVAVAYDQAYCGYYPETLDLLEAAGAELCDFSPLRSGSLPDKADVVYFGCGHPERDPQQLASNHCLKQSLRCYAARGGRIYAEGSGLAYLCREIVFPDGRTAPMTGLLPATARLSPITASAEPAEITFGVSSWLAPARVSLRGYRHAGWQIEPRGPMITYASDARQRLDILGRGNVIGSRILINLAANRHLLRRFFEPYAAGISAARQ